MNDKPYRALGRVIDRIKDEHRWAQGVTATDLYGVATMPLTARAAKWCVAGALECDIPDLGIYHVVIDALDDAAGGDIQVYNDDNDHAAEIALLSKVHSELKE